MSPDADPLPGAPARGSPGEHRDAFALPAPWVLGTERGAGGGGGRLQLPQALKGPHSRFGCKDHEAAAGPWPTPALPPKPLVSPPTSASPLLQRPMMPPQPPPCPVQQQRGSGRVPKGFHPFSTRSHVPLVAPKQKLPCHHSPRHGSEAVRSPARSGAVGLPLHGAGLIGNTTHLPQPCPAGPPSPMALAAHIWKGFSRLRTKP